MFVVHFFAIKAEAGGAELHIPSLRCFAPSLEGPTPNQAERASVQPGVLAEKLQA